MADRDIIPHSWDGNQINDGSDYEAGMSPGLEWGLPSVSPNSVPRASRWPVISAVSRDIRFLTLWIKIVGSDARSLRDQLMRWFDPEDEVTKNFVIKDEDGLNQRYVTALCTSFVPMVHSGVALRDVFLVTLAVHGDVRWRACSLATDTWSITASGDTKVITNSGNDDAYPVITVTPTSYKSGSADWTYQRFISIRWRADGAETDYPTDIVDDSFDTAALVSGGKMQADGDDLRVRVDGSEVDRWLQDINDATTQVWVNLDWSAKWEGTIEDAISSGGSVVSITVNEDTTALPNEGLLCVNSEIFTFTAKNNSTRVLTIGERAAKGSSAGSHSASDTIWWVQHDISILYGNAGASAPSVDDDYKPIFELDSTNTEWTYEEFGNDDETRTGSWSFVVLNGNPTQYTANRGTNADPWEEAGVYLDHWTDSGSWKLINQCEMTNVNFTNGEKYATDTALFKAAIWTNGTKEDDIAAPSSASTWESWSDDEALTADSTYLYFYLYGGALPGAIEAYCEVADVVITLNSSNTPAISIGAERSSYSLTFTLENTTTGDSISFDYSGLDLDESIVIDTDARTVIDSQSGISQFQALTLDGGPRRDWLKLERGSNTWEYTDANTTGVTVGIEFRPRNH